MEDEVTRPWWEALQSDPFPQPATTTASISYTPQDFSNGTINWSSIASLVQVGGPGGDGDTHQLNVDVNGGVFLGMTALDAIRAIVREELARR